MFMLRTFATENESMSVNVVMTVHQRPQPHVEVFTIILILRVPSEFTARDGVVLHDMPTAKRRKWQVSICARNGAAHLFNGGTLQ